MKRPATLWLLAALATAAAAYLLLLEPRAGTRSVTLALDFEEVQGMLESSGEAGAEEFWGRARAIGVRAVRLRPRRARELEERGALVHLPRAEAAKWVQAGLASPGSLPAADSLWLRERAAFDRALDSAGALRLSVSTRSYPGMQVLQLPPGTQPDALSFGFDPRAIGLLRSQDLLAVLQTSSPEDVEAALRDAGGRVVCLPQPMAPLSAQELERWGRLLDRLGRGLGWAVVPEGARGDPWTGLVDRLPEGTMLSKRVEAGETREPLWSAVLGRGARLLLLRLPPGAPDAGLTRLRETASALLSAGFSLDVPPEPGRSGRRPPLERGLRYAAAALLALFAPLWAARLGLGTLRVLRESKAWPQASPVPELAGALGASAFAAAWAGFLVYALLGFHEWRLGLYPGRWAWWARAGPLLLGALALYGNELPELRSRLHKQLTYLSLLKLTGAAAALAVLCSPWPVSRLPVPAWLWWLPSRWRESLVGAPCLAAALALQLRRLESGEGRRAGAEPDYRPWLLLGLLAPAGTLHAFGLSRGGLEDLLEQTLDATLLGCVLALAAWGAVAACRALLRPPRQARG